MNNVHQPKRGRGRPRKKADTDKLILALDRATCQKLDALIEYGGFGTGRREIVMSILRLWLWENDSRLKAAIASRDAPFGSSNSQQS